jgi:glycosyltransferase involved in cell wall biosynthesis
VNGTPRPPLHFAVPEGIDDPERVSGGNVYDRRLRDGLRAAGWEVRMLPVPAVAGGLAGELRRLPDGALVLVDGLLVSHDPAAVLDHTGRLRTAVLAHMVPSPLPDPERRALASAQRIVATSGWTRAQLIARGAADPLRSVVAHPGADPAPAVNVSASGGRLLCVGVVAPHKGQDLLVDALIASAGLPGWTCTIAGSLTSDARYAAALRERADRAGLGARLRFAGVLTGPELERAYADADLVVLPSRDESYSMALTESLAHGIPVVASGVGGMPEAIGSSGAALLVPSGDPRELAQMLQRWWSDGELRRQLTAAARHARASARGWAATTTVVDAALRELAGVAEPVGAVR